MQICIDVRALSGGGQSGIEEYTVQVINHLAATDQKNSYKLFYNGLCKAPLPPTLRTLQVLNVGVVDWKIPNKLFDLWPPPLDRFIEADLFYSPHLNILKCKNKPRILTVHDLSFVHHPHFFSFKHRLWHELQRLAQQIDRADHLVTDSQYTKSDLVEIFKVDPNKISVIFPGLNPEIKKINIDPQNRPDSPFLLYLGTLEPRKNIALIIAAFNLLKTKRVFQNLKLVLAGKWGWLYQSLVKDIKNSPHSKDIIVLGQINPTDKIMLYNLAEAFIYPSFFEGFGFPPLEAQTCGCPVIASNRTSLPEILSNSAILIDPWKPKVLASAIDSILTSAVLKRNLISLGQQNAKRFNWQKTACELLNLFSRHSS